MTEQPMPGIKHINGHTYIKIQDLANDWHTTTSSILATGKPRQVPAEYRRTIDGRTWCDVEGLRYRLNSMKRGGKIREQLRQLLDRFSGPSFTLTGPLIETIHENGVTMTIHRSTIQRIDNPSPAELQAALENRQIIYRYKNNRIQVLAQTLSNYLGTRTSSLLAVNKKQGVPAKFIHRAWKQTWVDLEGLKKRVEHTVHGSFLLKNLKPVLQVLDEYETALSRPLIAEESSALKPRTKRGQQNNDKPKQVKCCNVAVEANKRAIHNTSRINKLTRDEAALEKRLDRIEAGDRQATEAMAEKRTPFDALSQRVGGLVTHVDRSDARLEGVEFRVGVLEDTNKWLSWTLAGLVSLRFLGFTLRWLKRK